MHEERETTPVSPRCLRPSTRPAATQHMLMLGRPWTQDHRPPLHSQVVVGGPEAPWTLGSRGACAACVVAHVVR